MEAGFAALMLEENVDLMSDFPTWVSEHPLSTVDSPCKGMGKIYRHTENYRHNESMTAHMKEEKRLFTALKPLCKVWRIHCPARSYPKSCQPTRQKRAQKKVFPHLLPRLEILKLFVVL